MAQRSKIIQSQNTYARPADSALCINKSETVSHGADEAAEDGAAAKKRELEDDEAASEDDEIIPDLDDPGQS